LEGSLLNSFIKLNMARLMKTGRIGTGVTEKQLADAANEERYTHLKGQAVAADIISRVEEELAVRK
jgi:hypothetical protein